MRYLYLLGLALVAQAVHGQTSADTLSATTPPAADEVVRQIASRTDSTGLCTEIMSWGQAIGLVRIYYASGRLKEYVPYADLGADQIHGLVTTWYENGQLESQQPFLHGKREGKLTLYHESGQLKRLSEYVEGSELPGRCFDATGRAVPYFPYEQPAIYPGGQLQLNKEIGNAIRLPLAVTKLLGPSDHTVYISFFIDEAGIIQQPQVDVSSHIPALDHVVLATLHKLKYQFMPARRDGLAVRSKYSIPVWFAGMPYIGQPARK
jgi:protein TonB